MDLRKKAKPLNNGHVHKVGTFFGPDSAHIREVLLYFDS